MSSSKKQEWYGAKSLYSHDDLSHRHGKPCYEERIVMFLANDKEHAISLAEDEAREYVKDSIAWFYFRLPYFQ